MIVDLMVEFGAGLQSFPPFDKSYCNFSITIAYLPVVIHWKYKEHPDVFLFLQMKNKIKTTVNFTCYITGDGEAFHGQQCGCMQETPIRRAILLKMDIMRVIKSPEGQYLSPTPTPTTIPVLVLP